MFAENIMSERTYQGGHYPLFLIWLSVRVALQSECILRNGLWL